MRGKFMTAGRLCSLLVSAAMLISCVSVQAFAEEGAAYKATDAWYAPENNATENTYNGHAEWKWERKDSGRDWFDFAAFKTEKQVFGMIPPNVTGTENRIAGNAWTTTSGAWNHPAVGEGWMLPYMLTGHPDYAVSKTFTAPASGTVELSTEDGNIYGGSNQPGVTNNRTAFVRITVNNEQIWPDSGEGMRIPETDGQTLKFRKVTTKIFKGDKLRFEVYNGDSDAQNGKAVYWKPVVTYTDSQEGDVYNSLDTLKKDIAAKTVTGDTFWSWQVLRGDSGLTAFKNFNAVSEKTSMHLFAEPPLEDGVRNYNYRYSESVGGIGFETNALYSTSSDDNNNAKAYNVMSEWWMRPNARQSTGVAASSVAKVFTAPASGVIRISAVDGDGGNKIYAKKVALSSAKSGANVFIKKMPNNAAPTNTSVLDMSDAVYNHHFTYVTTAADEAVSVDFAPMTMHIEKGEKLWFVVNAFDTVSGNSKFVHWNPVVSYYSYDPFEISIDKSAVSFKSGEAELASFADIVSKDSVSVSVSATVVNAPLLQDGETRTAVVCAAVYDGSGKVIGTALSNIETFTKDSGNACTFTIDSLNIPETPESGFIRLFVFDNMASLNPLSAIGGENLYEQAPIDTASEVHISGEASADKAGGLAAVALYNSENKLVYVNQAQIGGDGSIDFAVPVTAAEAQAYTLVSNYPCAAYSKDIPVYCSAEGTADGLGTQQSPAALQRAIELAKDGGRVAVVGNVPVPADFVWQAAKKAITVYGTDEKAVLDISEVQNFNINTDVTFEDLTIGCKMSEDDNTEGYNRIWANGNHVIVRESVKTTNIIKGIYGGSSKKSVASVSLEVYGGNYNTILGGSSSDGGGAVNVNGDCILTVGGNVNSDYNSANWDNSNNRRAVIHGGGYGGTVKGDCILTLKDNVKAKYVYGGQNGQNTAVTSGKIIVNVEGGEFMNVFAQLKNTSGATNAELTMTGGTAEALMGSQENTTGNIRINALGGTVTRRIIGGVYNEVEKSSSADGHVAGSTIVVLGKAFDGLTYQYASRGIYPGSRTAKLYEDEVSTIVFTDDLGEKYSGMLSDEYHKDFNMSKSKYDYLVTATAGGSVGVKDSTHITVTPDTGYNAVINNAAYADTDYTLTEKETDIRFAKGIAAVNYTVNDNNTEVSVNYTIDADGKSVVIAALYDMEGNLVSIAFENVDNNSGAVSVRLPYNAADGKAYKLRAMIWDSLNMLSPRCGVFDTAIQGVVE